MNVSRIVTFALLCGLSLALGSADRANAALVNPIYLDLGPTSATNPNPPVGYDFVWNFVGPAPTPSVANLVDSTGASTGIALATTDTWQFHGSNGPSSTNGPALELWEGANDYLLVDSSNSNPTANLVLSGLTGASYNFAFFGLNVNSTSNRGIDITATGANSFTIENYNTAQHAANNDVAIINGITPDAGVITLDFAVGSLNQSTFAYIAAIKIEEVPEPASLGLLGIGLLAIARRRR